MKFHPLGLVAGALLLVAAQDAPNPPAKGSSFSEAFAEQSNAAKAERTADELAKPPAEPAAEPAEAAEAAHAPEAAVDVTPNAVPSAVPSAEAEQPAPTPAEAAETATAPAEPAPEVAAQPPASVAEAAPPPELAKGDPVTRDFLVGVWAEPGKSCDAGIDFQADGKMIGPFPRWELTDGELTMIGNRQKMRLSVIDRDTMLSRRSETDPGRTLKRCAKAPTPRQP